MGCQATLNFEAPAGAHLSFYWTMDEAGSANKLDSTVGMAWPLENGASAGVGLFSNGTNCDNPIILNKHRGLGTFGNLSITINQAVSKGISCWFWIQLVSYGGNGEFYMDTSDVAHTNRFRVLFSFASGASGSMEVGHTNDTDDHFADTPNLTWTLGSWHMVAITYDKVAQTLNIYIDGALSASTADISTYPDLTQTDMELANFSTLGAGSDFITDECGLCLNGALTTAQITSLWNGGSGVTWPNITPIVPYP